MRLVRNALLARILLPNEFGTMAIVLAINTFFESFTEVGIKQSVIQNPQGNKNEYLNSAWWLGFFRSILLYTIAFFSAPYIADFYNNEQLTLLIRISFLGLIFKGLMSTGVYQSLKNMNFKKWTIINNSGGLFGIFSAITLAFIYKNVWALAIGFLLEWVARFILSYILLPIRPKFYIEKQSMRELLIYAKGMLGLPILTFIFIRADIFVLGKLDTQANLGLYSMAAALAFIPLRLLTKVISETVMPAFSKMQNNFKNLNEALFKVTRIIFLMSMPMLIFASLSMPSKK